MEKNIILLAGKPGSGKSLLGRELSRDLSPIVSVEHLSVGDHIRAIGRGALSAYHNDVLDHLNTFGQTQPLDHAVMSAIVTERLEHAADAQLVLLDGFPRYLEQVKHLYNIAEVTKRSIKGMVVTHIDDEIAINRLLKRHESHPERQTDPASAQARIDHFNSTIQPVYDELTDRQVTLRRIDTNATKQATTLHGLLTVQGLLGINQSLSDDQ